MREDPPELPLRLRARRAASFHSPVADSVVGAISMLDPDAAAIVTIVEVVLRSTLPGAASDNDEGPRTEIGGGVGGGTFIVLHGVCVLFWFLFL